MKKKKKMNLMINIDEEYHWNLLKIIAGFIICFEITKEILKLDGKLDYVISLF